MNLLLCGLQKSGKTTIGSLLAKRLKREFIDTDHWIELAYALETAETGQQYSCRHIAKKHGEPFFRRLEKKQLFSLDTRTNCVVALGGGSLDDPEIRGFLQANSLLIYLKASPKLLWQRIAPSGIPGYLDPAMPEQSFYEIAEKRKVIFETCAQCIIETSGRCEEEVVEAILRQKNIFAFN